jgi:dTDP-glucose 4,6-dehydratase
LCANCCANRKCIPPTLTNGCRFIHGDGSNSRRYLYAGDVANAIDLILHTGEIGEIYNIGTHFEISNLNLARYLLSEFATRWNKDVEQLELECLEFVEDRAFNDKRYEVDCSKIERLGWKPTVTFEQGIKKTIEWYSQHGESWWGDISSALVPHPGKKIPEVTLVAWPSSP